MSFYADLHIHSKYSRATSRNSDLEHLALWARRKGLGVIATGDFTHPAWFDEIREKLVPAEPGLFRLRPELEKEIDRRLPRSCAGPTRFMLEVEISTIYKKDERTRKVHHLIYAPDIDTASRFRDSLDKIGNIKSDGRPILGLDSRHLLEITLESGPDAYLVPAHIWTPWFAALGSKSGFDSIEDCYGDLTEHIFAVETGLSSDPPMNWRVSSLDRFTLVSNSDAHSPPMLGREACVFDTELDYFAMRRALETGDGYGGTVEFFPEEGKYHLDGHRACQLRCEPDETRRLDGRCPTCNKPLTVGVMHRVETLADRPGNEPPLNAAPFKSIVPLPEIVSELVGVGPKSQTVGNRVATLVARHGPELDILERLPLEDIGRDGDPLFTEAIERLRQGRVFCEGGYDGEYGTVRLFEPGELAARTAVPCLFEMPEPEIADIEPIPVRTAWDAPRPPEVPTQPVLLEPTLPDAAAQIEDDSTEDPAATAAPAPPLTSRLLPFEAAAAPPSVLDRLDPDQRAAAEVVHGPLLIIAGPGTGKTRTLTHRIAHLVESDIALPDECLAITFTRRAAEELAERLEDLLGAKAHHVTVKTFHGLGLAILREQHAELGLGRKFRIAEEAERLDVAGNLFDLSTSQATKMLSGFSLARRRRAAQPDTLQPPTSDPFFADPLFTKLAAYEAALWQRDRVEFDDLLVLPTRLLGDRPDLRAEYCDRFHWISIDEYQDIDPLQYRLIQLLASPDANLCAIGDPDQSIYRFRGAEVGFFLRFQQDFPDANTVHLSRNYRSSRVIVAAALSAIAPASLVGERRLTAVHDAPADNVVVFEAASERAESESVVHSIERLLGGTSYFSVDSGRVEGGLSSNLSFDDFAVLYRTDAQSSAVIEALERSGIPYQKRSHNRLTKRPEVRVLLSALGHGALEKKTTKTRRRQKTVLDRLNAEAVRLATLTEASGDKTSGALGPAAFRQAVELVAPLAKRHGNDLQGFLAEVALGAEMDTWDPRAERVSLLTLHAAKGLEFPIVFIIGCEDGLLPLRFSTDDLEDDELDEERRLFFVGITRARTRLYLSYTRRRSWRGELRDRKPSPFLSDINGSLVEMRQSDERVKKRNTEPKQLSLL